METKSRSLPYRNGFRHSINIIWLIFRLVDLYSEGIHSTVKFRRLRWAVCFQNWLRRIWRLGWQLWFMLSFIWQEIMVELRTFKLTLKGPCSTSVRFCCKAVVRRSDCFLNLLSSINRAFIREAFLRIESGLHSVLSRGSENGWLILRWRRVRDRVNCNKNKNTRTCQKWSRISRHILDLGRPFILFLIYYIKYVCVGSVLRSSIPFHTFQQIILHGTKEIHGR